jgi:hypothetical protein
MPLSHLSTYLACWRSQPTFPQNISWFEKCKFLVSNYSSGMTRLADVSQYHSCDAIFPSRIKIIHMFRISTSKKSLTDGTHKWRGVFSYREVLFPGTVSKIQHSWYPNVTNTDILMFPCSFFIYINPDIWRQNLKTSSIESRYKNLAPLDAIGPPERPRAALSKTRCTADLPITTVAPSFSQLWQS